MTTTAIRRALYGKMAGDSTLNALLGSPAPGRSKAIYYELAPDGARFPYVVFNKQAGTPVYAFASDPAYEDNLWQIKGIDSGPDADTANGIGARLDVLLTDGALTISGATLLYLRRESDIEYSVTEAGVEYKHSGALFRLLAD